MKYIDINRRFTEIVSSFFSRGYIINSASMGGSQGETAKVDLTNGTEIIRVLVDTFHEWDVYSLDGVEIIVGRVQDDVTPNLCDRNGIIWNNRLEILNRERFYKLGEDRKSGYHYGSKDDALAVAELRLNRYRARDAAYQDADITDKVRDIAKQLIRREFGVKRICNADITVHKLGSGGYVVEYRGKTYRPH